MATIKVDMEAFYGCDCMGRGYGSNETVEIEVSDEVLKALKAINEEEVSAKDVTAAIENGHVELQSMHNDISERFYKMEEHYWLYEADNECEKESLVESFENDLNTGTFKPEMAPSEYGYSGDLEELFDRYRDWVFEHDNYFIAERVGCDLSACREDEPCYTIRFKNA